ncbi:hypothetical protein ACFWBH_03245 [Streptomyces sp. NPDC059999]|uniref:hypothetical protein n=1 Tax=Streptomyces sp. NPDC059999 TaxID=3347030 RepID=UPI0036CBC8B7
MSLFKTGDRVSVLYLSTAQATCLAYNRYVVEVEPDPEYGQRVWVEMPADCAAGPLLRVHSHPDFIDLMEADPLAAQTPGHLEANLNWHDSMTLPGSTAPSWPDGRNGEVVGIALTARERAVHAAHVVAYVAALNESDPATCARWVAADRAAATEAAR